MIRRIPIFVILAAALPLRAESANFAVITNAPTMLSVLVMFVAGAGLVISSQVWNMVKGGLMGRVWQMFMVGFLLLLLSQIVILLIDFEIVALPDFLAPAMIMLMTGLFLYGLLQARKVLG